MLIFNWQIKKEGIISNYNNYEQVGYDFIEFSTITFLAHSGLNIQVI